MAENKTDEIKDEPKETGADKAVEENKEEKKEAVQEEVAKEAAPQESESTEEPRENEPEVQEAAPEKTEEKVAAGQSEEPKEEETVEAAEESTEQSAGESKPLGNLAFLPELRTDLPELKTGDVIRVSYRVIEGGKERIQVFEGTIIGMKNSGISKTITVRKTSFGIAVERIFPVNSKLVQSIEVKKHSKVRRSKLYYLRKLKGKAARLKELR